MSGTVDLNNVSPGRGRSADNAFLWRNCKYTSNHVDKYSYEIPRRLSYVVRRLRVEAGDLLDICLTSIACQTKGGILNSWYTDLYIKVTTAELNASGFSTHNLARTLCQMEEAGVLFQVSSEKRHRSKEHIFRIPISNFFDEEKRRKMKRPLFIPDDSDTIPNEVDEMDDG
jgi:hypothetical protein